MYARDLRIVGNTLRGNLSGCVLMYGGPVVLQRNLIIESGSPSTGFGVLIKDAAGVRLERNVIAGNRIGLHVDDAGRTVGEPTSAVANTFALNQVGVVLFPSTDAGFTENSFVENSSQVAIGGSGTTQAVWDLRGTGNYWSDFAGVDADGDGRGDLPYTSSGRVGRLIADDPVLAALASGPAFRFLAGVEDRWGSSAPIVHDRAPLAAPRSWTIGADDRGPGIATAIPGAVVVAIGVWSLVRARRPRVLREVA
jgi:nitrous oxidase accessory protein